MKQNVILASFCKPLKETIRGEAVFSHASFHVMPLHWIRASALADEEIDASCNLMIFALDLVDSNEHILGKIWEQSPTIVAFSCHAWNIQKVLGICRRIKIVLPNVTIVLGGPEVSDCEFVFRRNPFVDIIVLGEGEIAFKKLLRALIHSKSSQFEIAGVCSNHDGKIAINSPGRPLDPKNLHSPYSESFIESLSGLVLYGTSRGCSFSCKFCSWHHSPKRLFPIDCVEIDLGCLLSNEKIKGIWFSDSEIDLGSIRTKRILKFVIENNVHDIKMFAFFNFLRADDEGIRLYSEANFSESPIIGLQSSSQKLHDNSGRKWFKVKKLEEKLPGILSHFPSASFDVIYGLPGDSYQKFKKTLRWCLDHGIKNLNLHRFMVTPGTEYSKNSAKNGIVFDRDVPHLSYASDSYSYSDIIKMESLANNFKILMSLLEPADYQTLNSNNIDLIQVMEDIDKHSVGWDSFFERKQEYDIEGIKGDVIKLVRRYFKSITNSKEIFQMIDELLSSRQKERQKKKQSDKGNEATGESPDGQALRNMLESYARKIILPQEIGQQFIGDWRLENISIDTGIVYVFRWKTAAFRIKLTKRDDNAPRLSYTKNFNIFYIDDDVAKDIPASERDSLLASFVSMARRGDTGDVSDHLT